MDANVQSYSEAYYEVGHHPSLGQLMEISRFMLTGGTRKPSMFTGVLIKYQPPKGLTWTVSDDGRALLNFESSDVETLLEQGTTTYIEAPEVVVSHAPRGFQGGVKDILDHFMPEKRDAIERSIKVESSPLDGIPDDKIPDTVTPSVAANAVPDEPSQKKEPNLGRLFQ